MSDALRDVFGNEVIRASAGTGKTYALSNRFLRLLASGAECESILATTFTRKGAGEILDRIVQRLAKATLSDQAADQLSKELNWQLDRSRVQVLLRDLIRNLHRLQIGTLDAFFYRIAQSFRLELGLPTQWKIVNEQQIEILQDRVIHEILRDKSVIDLLHLMTKGEAQRRIANLIRATVNQLYPIRVHSDRAAWDRLERPTKFNPNPDFSNTISHLQSIDFGHKNQTKQLNKEIELIESADWLALAKASIFKTIASGENSYYKKLPDECVLLYGGLIQHCRDFVVDMLIRKNLSTFALLDTFGKRFESDKSDSGQLRFEDITVRLESFISQRKVEDFAFRLDHNVNHLLLDEFQDTSISQWKVIEPFAERTVEDDTKKSFFCVGDLKQAIFGWRGGVAEIFDTVENQLSNMTQAEPLLTSYRSSPVVIDAVNQVFDNLDRFKIKDKLVTSAVHNWSERFETHQTALEDLNGYFAVEYAADSDVKNRWEKNSARNNNLLVAAVERIRDLHEKMPGKSIGVLVRKNETIGQLIYMLQGIGLSASEEGGNPLTDSAAVELMLSLVTLADHPGDGPARFHLSHSPLAEELGLVAETKSNQTENKKLAASLAAKVRQELLSLGYGATIEKYAQLLAPHCTRRELVRLQQLVQETYSHEKSIDTNRIKLRPSRFVHHIRHEFRASDETSSQIRVMTIHQSKGLEFDVVVLPMLYEQNGWFGHQNPVIVGRDHPTAPINLVCRLANESHRELLPTEFQEAFNEHRCHEVRDAMCLLYVAMTRAVHATHVLLSYGCKTDLAATPSVLLSALEITERNEGTVYSLGDEHWCKLEEPNPSQEEENELDLSPYYLPNVESLPNVKLANKQGNSRAIQKVSPSDHDGLTEHLMGNFFKQIDRQELKHRGLVMHAGFENTLWLDESRPDQKSILKTIGVKDWDPKLLDRWIDDFLGAVEQPNVSHLLTRQTYMQEFLPKFVESDGLIFDAVSIEVETERSIAALVNDQLVQGVLDRVVWFYDGQQLIGADIIDFKTDKIERANVEERAEYYRGQIERYRDAVSEMT
ncbi:MAG: UvrD-helicase domain-containing protein, partial [Planctomycetota bacterium]